MQHESAGHDEEIVPGSNRSFGLIVGGILFAIGAYQYYRGYSLAPWFAAPGGVLIVLGLVWPSILAYPNLLWTKLGILLGRIVTPIVMFLVYAVTVVPIGLMMRVSGKNLLTLKADQTSESYWIERTPPGPPPESLKDQF